MSNRRRLPRDRKPRCKKCRTALVHKEGYGLVCDQCGTPAPVPTEGGEQP